MTYPRNARMLALVLTAATCLALGACKKDESPAQNAAAGAKILPRSVGDDMLPYDTVRSQSAPAAPESGSQGFATSPRATASEAAAPEDTAANAAAAAAADVEAAAAGPVQ